MELTPFEFCLRRRVRFETDKGSLTLEQLFDIPLTSDTGKANLNQIAKTIYGRLNKDETNFVDMSTPESTSTDSIMLEAVKRVIAIRQAENREASTAREKAAKKAEIMDALADAERGALKSKSPDELRAMLASL